MESALSLAELALGHTSPNPAVGAVVVKEGAMVGVGYTQPAGAAHAEVMALRQAGENAKGATMYVTLEPCCHHGKTPPCTEAVIDAGIGDVHIALLDPNPVVSGNGVKRLNEAGISTYVGKHQQKAEEINEAYIKFITSGLPFVTAKFAMSLDGKIATRSNQSKWISNKEAREYVHTVRHVVDAIVVGVNTVLVDDPRLTARGCCGRGGNTKSQPLRIIVDSKGRTPSGASVFKQPGETLIATVQPMDKDKKEKFVQAGAEVLEIPEEEGKVDVEELSRMMAERGIVSILVEGGGALLGSFFDSHLVDKVLVFISPIVIGGDGARAAVGGNGVDSIIEAHRLIRVDVKNFGDNILVSGYVEE
jgi:diaminohydroxyphosphoribosylaminopyrimidine deaminase/5-amino-6-(5-phosphoribosylamino)uracil reductase